MATTTKGKLRVVAHGVTVGVARAGTRALAPAARGALALLTRGSQGLRREGGARGEGRLRLRAFQLGPKREACSAVSAMKIM
eukprot:2538775-Pyramimonas_sp.AAC.1